jgi:hypothetical protein
MVHLLKNLNKKKFMEESIKIHEYESKIINKYGSFNFV